MGFSKMAGGKSGGEEKRDVAVAINGAAVGGDPIDVDVAPSAEGALSNRGPERTVDER